MGKKQMKGTITDGQLVLKGRVSFSKRINQVIERPSPESPGCFCTILAFVANLTIKIFVKK